MDELAGVIYPVPETLTSRFFDRKTKVFAKFLAHNSTKLLPKHKVIFYGSRGRKKLVGEGTIEKVEFLSSEFIINKYKDVLFLRENEFRAYVGNRIEPLLTLTLKKLVKYPNAINSRKPITMAGQYITINEYNALIKDAYAMCDYKI